MYLFFYVNNGEEMKEELKSTERANLRLNFVGSRVRSASNVTVITRNLPRKLRVGKIENYP